MYEWLREELARIRWPGFHKIISCWGATLDPSLPPSYLVFVRQFGAAKLYLMSGHYQLGVLCPPEWARLPQGDALRIGWALDNDAYVMTSQLVEGKEAHVYKLIDGELFDTADDFASWLASSAEEARQDYTTEDWTRLERGPAPFTPDEQSILEARRKLVWKFLGAGPGPINTLRFSVRNGSGRFVKALTLGVRHRDGFVEGRLPVDTSGIAPSDERIIDVRGYETLAPEDAVVFDLPEPTPAERDHYAELATSGPMKR